VTLDDQIAAFATAHHGTVALRAFAGPRVTHRERHVRLDAGRWVELYPGVYRIGGAPETWRSNLLAACWAGGERAVASHRGAAALWQLPGGREVVEITCPRWRRTQKEGELVVHESRLLAPADVTVLDAIPCTAVERTIFDLAGIVQSRTLDLAIDSALRRELTTVGALVELGDRVAKRGRPGSALFRAAVSQRDPESAVPESEPERLLAQELVRHGLPHPTHQFVVRNTLGAFIARVDLAYPFERVVIEYESYAHHTGKVALARDSARRNAIVASGYTVITATAEDLRDGAGRVADAVRQSLNATNRRQSKPL
jgi:very-short-patch-repair endonuclease